MNEEGFSSLLQLRHQTDCIGVILQFFGFKERICKLSLVCKDWMKLIKQLPIRIHLHQYSNWVGWDESNSKTYRKMIKSEFLNNLIGLEMSGCVSEDVKNVVKKYSKLEYLSVHNCHPRGAFAVAKYLPNLTALDFSESRILNIGSISIVKSENMRNLTSLNLDYCKVSEVFARELVSSPYMNNLNSLSLKCNNLKVEGVKILSQSPILSNLTFLKLERNRIGKEGLSYLCNSIHMNKLTSLNLKGNSLGDEGMEILTSHNSILKKLTLLNLSGNSITDEGIRTLVNSPDMSNLSSLYLGNNDGYRGWFKVYSLYNNYTKLAVEMIVESPFMKQLKNLQLIPMAEKDKVLLKSIPNLKIVSR
ncbi:leucine-rich repeat, typical subtype-like protein [Naegleria gruberi]|uniref:Leucine-rich repeat, typical subtype-like protein n=1 Tax=Naegleria gruberi TaxID=5762 RepID=D2V2F3_NAEGR|nr:leucine-rich repeat, typical subtype-like protein [Naegleria gruberi]EFC48889.1 leucine-rich repeat, typical subtype-like protein [Naegleria gruberi]|eukprot:XP_002681633.1 leucine-rich repeat, typical subtype-like protein [Naegleria gruberi strain NEG-M]